MDRRRMRNLIPPTYGLLIVAGFLVSATVGIIILIVGGSVTGLLWSTLSRGGDTAAQKMQGKWLKATTTTGAFSSCSSLTNLHALFSQAFASHGTLAEGQTTTVDGQQVITIRDTTKGGTLYVATTGNPYPVEIRKAGSQTGTVVFDQYNQPVSLSAPTNVIDSSAIGL